MSGLTYPKAGGTQSVFMRTPGIS